MRKQKKELPYEDEVLLEKLESKDDTALETSYIKEALAKLKPAYQTAIILFYYHDLSIKDISAVLEKPEGTIKTHLRRAKKELKTEIERSHQLNEKFI